MKRHFAHPNPRFGTKKNPANPSAWKNSIYYLWFEYLRRNEDYKATCENGGKGKCANLFMDFGDIYSEDFKTWWQTDDHGAILFAEPPKRSIEVITESNVLSKLDEKTLVLSIPLNLPSAFLVKRYREILKKYHAGERGIKALSSSKSNALYPTTTDRIAINFLEVALKVWDERKANPKKPLWLLAQDLNLSMMNHVPIGKNGKIPRGGHVANQKNRLAATASRYLRKANAAIVNIARGRFPDYSIPKTVSSKRKPK